MLIRGNRIYEGSDAAMRHGQHKSGGLARVVPLAGRFVDYRREHLIGDLIAGVIVAILLVPQSMAYAMLAGLPPQVGLYASIVPVLLYSLFGTSNTLAVGPVAMVSLLVVSGVGELAEPGSGEFIGLCLTLALLVGLIQVLMAVFRMGFLVNFISHPVLIGFTSASAMVIGFSQRKHLFGVTVHRSEYPFQLIAETLTKVVESNPTTLAIGLGSVAVLVLFGRAVGAWLKRIGFNEAWAMAISRTGPLVVVAITATVVYAGRLDESGNVAIMGEIPPGLPSLTIPELDLDSIRSLLPLALVITLVGYLESISVAKALASRHREKVDPNRELFALGLADVGAAFAGGYPVTGGFSRSMVNFTAGAHSPLASVVTAGLVALSIAVLTPLFFYIPKAVLAAIILVAVVKLIDLKAPLRLWKYSRADAIALLASFAAVLGLGIETGILIGVVSTIAMLMWHVSRPHIAEVGRVPGTEHFRNVDRHGVIQNGHVLAVRFDESLTFANAPYLESYFLERISERPDLKFVLLIAAGINDIDATGLEVLETIREELKSAGVEFFMSDVKGPVMDRIQASGFDSDFLHHNIFLSAHLAMQRIAAIESAETSDKLLAKSSTQAVSPQASELTLERQALSDGI